MLSTRDPSLPAIESLVLHDVRSGIARTIAIDPHFDCRAIPAEPDRYEAYPRSFAAREALAAIGSLYTELGDAIRTGRAVSPDFDRAVAIERLLSSAEAAALDPRKPPSRLYVGAET